MIDIDYLLDKPADELTEQEWAILKTLWDGTDDAEADNQP